jgi:hypothetical protein
MIRTIFLLAASLILILSFAVHSATIDSDYYLINTGNHAMEAEPEIVASSNATWNVKTSAALTWVNFSVTGAPSGSTLTVTANNVEWWHHPLLGHDDANNFKCIERTIGLSQIIEHCTESNEHQMLLENGTGILRGLVSIDLPTGGIISSRQISIEDARIYGDVLIAQEFLNTTWIIHLVGPDGAELDPAGIEINLDYSTHLVEDVYQFKVDPFEELIWSIAALIGCFGIVLIIPLTVYFAARAKEKKNELIRIEPNQPKV